MRNRQGTFTIVAALIASSGVIGVAVATGVQKTRTLRLTAAPGHPTSDMATPASPNLRLLDMFATEGEEGGLPSNEIVIPVLSGLESGEYVNFDSPPVKPLAMAGARLLVTNTPAGTLEILRTDGGNGGQLEIDAVIPVGIDPVAVAVEPGTDAAIAWVSNYVSDSISIVDLAAGRVIDVLEAGDEPSTIVFSPDGTTAYVVFEGAAPTQDNEFIEPAPAMGVYDVATRQLLTWVELPADTPRGLVIDAETNQLFISSLHSGNNTTTIGEPVFHVFIEDDEEDRLIPVLQVVRDFSLTAAEFAASSFAPWPPVSAEPGAPLTNLIIADDDAEWQGIKDALSDGQGDPDPAVVSLYASEFGMAFEDAEFVIEHVISDAKDTVDNDIIVLDASVAQAPVFDRVISDVGTILTSVALRPGSPELFVANLEALNTVRHEPNLNGHFFDHEIVRVPTVAPASPQSFDLHAGISGFNDPDSFVPTAASESLANPVDIVFTENGSRAIVAALGPGRVGLLDASNMTVLARANTGRGTRAVVLDGTGRTAYTYNRTDNSVTAVTLGLNDSLTAIDTLDLFNPEPLEVTEGRNFLYSTEFSFNNASSCALCHIDNHLDGLAWDLGDPAGELQPGPSNVVDPDTGEPLMNHPAKGPMVTMSLRGLRDHNAYHWRSDKPAFEDFNGAFENLLGGDQLPPEDMTKYREFIDTVAYSPNPFYDRDNSFKDPRAVNGAGLYITNCDACHSLTNDGTLRLAGLDDDAGMTLFFLFAQIQEMTQLRGIHRKFDMDLYSGFGLIHDGREEREDDAHPINTFLSTFFRNIPVDEHEDMIAFLDAFQTNVMSIVGWEVRYDQFASAAEEGDIDLMISRAEPLPGFSNRAVCDVIARGVIDGQPAGFVFNSRTPEPAGGGKTVSGSSGNAQIAGNGVAEMPGRDQTMPAPADDVVFLRDTGGRITLDDLLILAAQPGNHLDFGAVTPGSGKRLGIDADLDGIRNGLDPFAYMSPDVTQDGVIDATDLTAYMDLYNAPDPAADYDGDRDVDVDDLDAYLFEFTIATG